MFLNGHLGTKALGSRTGTGTCVGVDALNIARGTGCRDPYMSPCLEDSHITFQGPVEDSFHSFRYDVSSTTGYVSH